MLSPPNVEKHEEAAPAFVCILVAVFPQHSLCGNQAGHCMAGFLAILFGHAERVRGICCSAVWCDSCFLHDASTFCPCLQLSGAGASRFCSCSTGLTLSLHGSWSASHQGFQPFMPYVLLSSDSSSRSLALPGHHDLHARLQRRQTFFLQLVICMACIRGNLRCFWHPLPSA